MNGKKSLAADRRRRKLMTLGWCVALLILIIVLIAFEKTAILYILATLGISALLLVVAMKDLGHEDGKIAQNSSPSSEAARSASSSK